MRRTFIGLACLLLGASLLAPAARASQGEPRTQPSPDPTESPTPPPGHNDFEITPSSFAFDKMCVGVTQRKTFTITNTGNNDLHIDSITSSAVPPFSTTPPAPRDVLVGHSATFDVVFSPVRGGQVAATITVSANAEERTASVLGDARDAEISVAPLSLSFGALRVGSVSEPRSVVIASTGSEELQVTGITLSGSGDFSKGAVGPTTLQPGAQLRVPMTFSPRSLGKRFASLAVTSDSCNAASRLVELRGTGGQPGITVLPGTLVVSAGVGAAGVPGSVTILSSGLTALTIRSLSLTGAEADQFVMTGAPRLPSVLQPGDAIVLDIRFRPTAEKDPPPEAVLLVGSNDPKRPAVKIPVNGVYASPTPSPTPSPSASPSATATADPAAAGGGGPGFGDYAGELLVLLTIAAVFLALVVLRNEKMRRIARRAGA